MRENARTRDRRCLVGVRAISRTIAKRVVVTAHCLLKNGFSPLSLLLNFLRATLVDFLLLLLRLLLSLDLSSSRSLSLIFSFQPTLTLSTALSPSLFSILTLGTIYKFSRRKASKEKVRRSEELNRIFLKSFVPSRFKYCGRGSYRHQHYQTTDDKKYASSHIC